MTEWVKRSERVTVVEFFREFEWADMPGAGFGFPCDEQGNLTHDNEAAAANYLMCLAGEDEQGRKIIDHGVERREHSYREPGVIRCAVCSAEVVLDMVMTNTCHSCRYCGKESDYFWHLISARQCDALMQAHEGRDCAAPDDHHTFMPCEADYNSSGQRLAPREQWGWDTGESLGDILNSDWPVGVSRAEYMGEE